MSRFKVSLATLCLLSSIRAVSADVIYSNFVAGNGYDANPSSYFSVTNSGLPSVTLLAAPFTVPPGINYTLTEVDLVASVNDVHRHIFVSITTDPRAQGNSMESASLILKTTPTYVTLTPQVKQTLLAGTQYYVVFFVDTAPPTFAAAQWYKNSSGDTGTVYFSDLSQGDINFYPRFTNAQYPVFRIVGTPVPAPPVKPAYSAFGTVKPSNVPVSATVFAEVICPPDKAQFTCPVSTGIPANATPAQICKQISDAINAHQYGCWGPADPLAFHASCDGDNVRVTNSTTGLCSGAFVCIDHVENVTKFASKKSLSYEYTSVEGPLRLQMRGPVSGVAVDPAYSDEIQIDYRGLSSGTVAQVTVPLSAGSTPQEVAFSLEAALEENIEERVVVAQDGLYFLPAEPYDLTVKLNDSTLDWALSPIADLLARSDVNPAPTPQGNCVADATRLCLNQSRFQVEAMWHTPQGAAGNGMAVPITDDTGYFWFFGSSNVEVVVKVLNACAPTSRFWVFAGGLTNVGVEMKVTDTLTGEIRMYQNRVGAPFQPIQDTSAFATCGGFVPSP